MRHLKGRERFPLFATNGVVDRAAVLSCEGRQKGVVRREDCADGL